MVLKEQPKNYNKIRRVKALTLTWNSNQFTGNRIKGRKKGEIITLPLTIRTVNKEKKGREARAYLGYLEIGVVFYSLESEKKKRERERSREGGLGELIWKLKEERALGKIQGLWDWEEEKGTNIKIFNPILKLTLVPLHAFFFIYFFYHIYIIYIILIILILYIFYFNKFLIYYY